MARKPQSNEDLLHRFDILLQNMFEMYEYCNISGLEGNVSEGMFLTASLNSRRNTMSKEQIKEMNEDITDFHQSLVKISEKCNCNPKES